LEIRVRLEVINFIKACSNVSGGRFKPRVDAKKIAVHKISRATRKDFKV